VNAGKHISPANQRLFEEIAGIVAEANIIEY
jgi:hypothetical protein